MPNLPASEYFELIEICNGKGWAQVAAAELIYSWRGSHNAISRSDAFVMAAVMSSCLRIYYTRFNSVDDSDSIVGDCMRKKIRDYNIYIPDMMEALKNYSIDEELRSVIRDAIPGMSLPHGEKAMLILTIYAQLALWAAVTIFPEHELRGGERDHVRIMCHFAKVFDECYNEWMVLLHKRGILLTEEELHSEDFSQPFMGASPISTEKTLSGENSEIQVEQQHTSDKSTSQVVNPSSSSSGCLVLIIAFLSLAALAFMGCGFKVPSTAVIERVVVNSIRRETGIYSGSLDAKAEGIGNGRWDVRITGERYDGERRTLNATAVMDKNGDIHYYTE